MSDFGKALKQLRERERQPYLTGLSPVSQLTLSAQLQFLKTARARTYVPVDSAVCPPLPSGEVERTRLGHHYIVRNRFVEDHFHGKVRLSRFSTMDLQALMALMKQQGNIFDRDRIVFLDTETTGMQGGAGICPFLIGVGYYTGQEFEMAQYFMRDFDEEPSMLHALGSFLDRFDLVITYNGASFDIPLLETRFTLARLDNPFGRIRHFDLLNSARRLWRNGHGSCRLTALERLLSFARGPDLPGAMIPRVYFDFLQRHASPELGGVFRHNLYDVVSLAALTIYAADQIASDPAPLDDPQDIYSLARIFENSKQWLRSMRLYEMAIAGGLEGPLRAKALESLSVLYRRAGDHERSLEICRQLMGFETFSIIAYEGAAIYFERFSGNPEAALAVIAEGLRRLEDLPPNRRWRSLLQARWNRLQQKVIGFPSSAIW